MVSGERPELAPIVCVDLRAIRLEPDGGTGAGARPGAGPRARAALAPRAAAATLLATVGAILARIGDGARIGALEGDGVDVVERRATKPAIGVCHTPRPYARAPGASSDTYKKRYVLNPRLAAAPGSGMLGPIWLAAAGPTGAENRAPGLMSSTAVYRRRAAPRRCIAPSASPSRRLPGGAGSGG